MSKRKPKLEEALDTAKLEAELEDLRAALRREQAKVAKGRVKRDEVAAIVRETTADAVRAAGPLTPVPPPKLRKRRGKPEVALWHLTDWQGSKVTSTYNSAVMRERVLRFCEKAAKLTEIQRADHPVDEAMVLLGGDMIEGLFNFPTQPYEIDASLFGQYVGSARLIAEALRRALAIYRSVSVVSEWGNHGRIGSKRAAVPKADNADRMVYALAQEKLSGEDRLTWAPIDETIEDMQRVEVGNYRALLIHGDEIGRTGYVARTTMVKKVADWKSGAYPWSFQDCYCGHYHVHGEDQLPDGRGTLFQTGSTESDNRYARDTMASAGSPSQRLHFIDPEDGLVTCQYKVRLA